VPECDDESVPLDPQDDECDDDPVWVEDVERPDEQGSPGACAADIPAGCCCATQSLRGIIA
jgi:hypothetical protein